jgi:hypothetical protein
MVKDIARLGRLTQSQARSALEELVASGTVPMLPRADTRYPRAGKDGFIKSRLAEFPSPGLDGCPLGSRLRKCLAQNKAASSWSHLD